MKESVDCNIISFSISSGAGVLFKDTPRPCNTLDAFHSEVRSEGCAGNLKTNGDRLFYPGMTTSEDYQKRSGKVTPEYMEEQLLMNWGYRSIVYVGCFLDIDFPIKCVLRLLYLSISHSLILIFDGCVIVIDYCLYCVTCVQICITPKE